MMTYAMSLIFFVFGIFKIVLDRDWLIACLCFLVYAILRFTYEMQLTREELERWEDELDE